MRSRIPFVLAILASIGGFGACSETLPRGQDGVAAIQFRDMVVPSGLRLVDESHESHSVETPGWRYGQFLYSGLVGLDEAADYVRQQMPRHNWTLTRDETSKQPPITTSLRFERGYYVVEYVFSRKDGRTQLVVDYDTDYTQHQ